MGLLLTITGELAFCGLFHRFRIWPLDLDGIVPALRAHQGIMETFS